MECFHEYLDNLGSRRATLSCARGCLSHLSNRPIPIIEVWIFIIFPHQICGYPYHHLDTMDMGHFHWHPTLIPVRMSWWMVAMGTTPISVWPLWMVAMGTIPISVWLLWMVAMGTIPISVWLLWMVAMGTIS